jgi:hypothetical protein
LDAPLGRRQVSLRGGDVLAHSRRDIRKRVYLTMGMAERRSDEFTLVLEGHDVVNARVESECLATIDPGVDHQSDPMKRKVREGLSMIVGISDYLTVTVRRSCLIRGRIFLEVGLRRIGKRREAILENRNLILLEGNLRESISVDGTRA